MQHETHTFAGAGGLQITWQSWVDEMVPRRGALVISHGAGEHAGRYAHVVERLVPDGWAVYGIDHRGHGRSEGQRAVIDRLDNAIVDLNELIGLVRAEQPGAPLVLLGHSLGGCIAFEYALRHQDQIDALILSGAAVALEAASPVQRIVARALSSIAPGLGVLAVDPSAISTDPSEVAAYEADPLVHHGKVPVRTIAEAASAIETFERRAPKITVPLLVIHGADDTLTPPAGSEMVNQRVSSTDRTLKIYPGMRHEMFNERPASRAEVLDDMSGWLSGRFAVTTAR